MTSNFNIRCGLAAVSLCALLGGCGGSQASSSFGPIGVALQTQAQQPQGHSWMDPKASRQSLLYVTDGIYGVYVYTYPQGHLVGELSASLVALDECVDSAGDIFIVSQANYSGSSSIIYEYAHGGTQPIAMLADPAGGGGCAVDPTSGNLAVANKADPENPYGDYGDVAVYADAQGNPTMYYSSTFVSFDLCGYDTKGNLYLSAASDQYLDQSQLVRLPADSGKFEQISLNVTLYSQGGTPSVQWDGKYMTVSSSAYKEPVDVYRLRISGDNATVVGTATLSSEKNTLKMGQVWIQGKRVLGADYLKGWGVDSWSYPDAKKARTIVPNTRDLFPWGIAVSLATSQ